MPGVRYHPWPAAVALRRWIADPTDLLCFRMPLSARGELAASDVRSLVDLRGALQQKTPRPAGTDAPPESAAGADLVALDAIADRLLEIAAQGHAAGQGLGLLAPDNVLAVTLDGTTQVILPDAGFVWDRRKGPRRPRWLRDDVGWRQLWDRAPGEINQWLLDGERDIQQHDLRTLARLFAWLLVGEATLAEWEPEGPLTRIPDAKAAPATRAEVWGVLDDVLSGAITTAAEFRRQFQQAGRLSAHFRQRVHPPPKPPPRPWWPWAVLLPAVLLAVGAAGGWYLHAGPPRSVPVASPLCPDCPVRTAVGRGLEELADVRRRREAGEATLENEWEVLRALHGSELSPLDQVRKAETQCLATLRREFLNHVAREVETLLGRLADLPGASDSDRRQVQRLLTLADEASRLSPGDKEPTWCISLRKLHAQYQQP